jgi:hypothetical protein
VTHWSGVAAAVILHGRHSDLVRNCLLRFWHMTPTGHGRNVAIHGRNVARITKLSERVINSGTGNCVPWFHLHSAKS